jgi:hypothetical protein
MVLFLFAPGARADIVTEIGGALGDTTRNFVVLYEGSGSGNNGNLHIAAGTMVGNIGIGNNGSFSADGGGTLKGNVAFSGSNTGQFTTASGYTLNGSVLYGQSDVTTDLNNIGLFSAKVAGESGTILVIDPSSMGGTQSIFASAGVPDSGGNRVFNVTSFNFAKGTTITINGDSSGDNVILNFNTNNTLNFDGAINFNGITPDQVLFNITGGGELKIDGATVAGDFVDLNGQMMVSGSTVSGRLFGGDDDRLQIVSGSMVFAPGTFGARAPEPAAIVLVGTVCLGVFPLLRRRFRRVSPKG